MFFFGFSRFIGSILWGILWSLIWLYFIVIPLTVYIYLEGTFLHKVEILLFYAIGLLVSAAFLNHFFMRWFVYLSFLIFFGLLGISFMGAPFNRSEKVICSANINQQYRPISFPLYNVLLNYDAQKEVAIFYWRSKPWPFYKKKIIIPQDWPSGFTSSTSQNIAQITCLQNLLRLKNL